jgi:hypothetical protein
MTTVLAALILAQTAPLQDVEVRNALSPWTPEHGLTARYRRPGPLAATKADEIVAKVSHPLASSRLVSKQDLQTWKTVSTATDEDLGRYLKDTNRRLKWGAISEVAYRKLPRYRPDLERLVEEGWPPAAWALTEVGSDRVFAARQLQHSQPRIRLWAAYTLAAHGDERGREPLWKMLREERLPWHAGPLKFAQALLPFERHDAARLHELIIVSRTHRFAQFVAQVPTPQARQALERLILEHPYHSHREWGVAALASRQDGLAALQRIAKNKANKDAATAAQQAISMLNSRHTVRMTLDNWAWERPRE